MYLLILCVSRNVLDVLISQKNHENFNKIRYLEEKNIKINF